MTAVDVSWNGSRLWVIVKEVMSAGKQQRKAAGAARKQRRPGAQVKKTHGKKVGARTKSTGPAVRRRRRDFSQIEAPGSVPIRAHETREPWAEAPEEPFLRSPEPDIE